MIDSTQEGSAGAQQGDRSESLTAGAEQSIQAPEIQEIVPRLSSAVAELKEAFERGSYGMVIGDDISGRIVTLIMRGVINHINDKHGRPPIPTFFTKPYKDKLIRSEKQKILGALVRFLPKGSSGRVLIVTEHMSLGKHIGAIGKLLHENDREYDVVTARQASRTDDYRNQSILRDDEEIYPKSRHSDEPPMLDGAADLTGLRKDTLPVRADRARIKWLQRFLDKGPDWLNRRKMRRARAISARNDVQIAVRQIIQANNL